MLLYFNVTCNNELILICVVKFFVGFWPKKWVNWIFKEFKYNYCHLEHITEQIDELLPASYNLLNLYRDSIQTTVSPIRVFTARALKSSRAKRIQIYHNVYQNDRVQHRTSMISWIPKKIFFQNTLRRFDLINHNLATKCGRSD